MRLKDIVPEDFVNYKKPSMFIIFPSCDFKCDKEYGTQICQNLEVSRMPDKDISIDYIVESYLNNEITQAVVCGGLEPFRSFPDLLELVKALREHTNDDIVIYTGYRNEEVAHQIDLLSKYENIIVKFGRYIPNVEPRYEPVLGVQLASKNQYACKLDCTKI